jgi:YHS domain-containing protein
MRVTVRVGRVARTIALSSRERPVTREAGMAIEIDPVCGMDVDTTTSELSFEYHGKTYWFCARGCLLEFRDDPERYLAADGPASA